jgi:hypothetical protein
MHATDRQMNATHGRQTQGGTRSFGRRLKCGLTLTALAACAALAVGPLATMSSASASIGGSNDCMVLSNGDTLDIGATVSVANGIAAAVSTVQSTSLAVWLPLGVTVLSDAPGAGVQVTVNNNDSLATYRADVYVQSVSGTAPVPVSALMALSGGKNASGSGSTNQTVSVKLHD